MSPIHLDHDPTRPAPRPSKYRNKPVRDAETGRMLGSQAEARHIANLRLLARQGLITNLVTDKRDLRYPFVINGHTIGAYEADARYTDGEGREVVEDVKGGAVTPVYRLKKKLVKALYGIDIVEVRNA